ncbi:MAG TPA: YopX family protein [Sphingobacteriaceae bacterium]
MQLPKYRAWIKPLNKMVKVSKLILEPEEEAGIEYTENGQKKFVAMKDCEVQQSINIFDHSGNEYYFYDVILTKTGIGVLVLCDGNLGLASWINGAYHCFCNISKSELEHSEILGHIYEDSSVLIEETA